MTDIILIIIAVTLAVAVGFIISTLIEFKRTASRATIFLESTEESLNSALNEISETTKGIRDIVEDINSVTHEAKSITSSLNDFATSLKGVGEQIEGAMGKFAALKVGIGTAFEVFMKNLILRRGGK